jgi:hypothetical protein
MATSHQPERIETMNTETNTANTTYEVKASLPRGIQFHTSSWECDTQEEAMNLADNLAADGWKMVCVFETTTRVINW